MCSLRTGLQRGYRGTCSGAGGGAVRASYRCRTRKKEVQSAILLRQAARHGAWRRAMPWRNVTAAQALLHGSETHRGRVRAGKQVTRHRHARLLVAAPPAELSFNNEHDETSSAHTETGVREVGDERIHNQLQSCAPACSSSNRENREREGERGRESELAREL